MALPDRSAGSAKPLFRSHDDYLAHCLLTCRLRLRGYDSVDAIAEDQDRINRYPRIDRLRPPRNVEVLEDALAGGAGKAARTRALACLLDGSVLMEHALAGGANRLGLGNRFLLNLPRDFSAQRIAALINRCGGPAVSAGEVAARAGCRPADLLPLSLGVRHMLQHVYELERLALAHDRDPARVIRNQTALVILDEVCGRVIMNDFLRCRFFGLPRANVLFMCQKGFHGIGLRGREFFYDRVSERRLHNHGQMALQQTLDMQIFRLQSDDHQQFLSAAQFGDLLCVYEDKISSSIGDLCILTRAVDLDAVALALLKGASGTRMLMEVVAGPPRAPLRGGMLAWDGELQRNVMVESFRLADMPAGVIRFVNRNHNHYPAPVDAWRSLARHGLDLPLTVKGRSIYFQPVQGDINFFVPTAFFRRRQCDPLCSMGSVQDLPAALCAMHRQDRQPGFEAFARRYVDF